MDGIVVRLASATQAGLVAEAVIPHGWIVTRDGKDVAIEPYPTSEIGVPVGTTIYHVSERHHRASIASKGLRPREGGNTTLQRSYPRRLHMASNFSGALAFVHYQVTSNAAWTFDANAGGSFAGPTKRKLEEMDVYAVASPAGSYHRDSHFEANGIWTERSIAAKYFRLLEREEWIPIYLKLFERGAWPQP